MSALREVKARADRQKALVAVDAATAQLLALPIAPDRLAQSRLRLPGGAAAEVLQAVPDDVGAAVGTEQAVVGRASAARRRRASRSTRSSTQLVNGEAGGPASRRYMARMRSRSADIRIVPPTLWQPPPVPRRRISSMATLKARRRSDRQFRAILHRPRRPQRRYVRRRPQGHGRQPVSISSWVPCAVGGRARGEVAGFSRSGAAPAPMTS